MELASEGIDAVQIAKDEGGQDEVGCGVLDGQCCAASEVQLRFGSELDGGALQHFRGGIHSYHTGGAKRRQKLKPSACTAAGIENIEAADIGEQPAEKALFQRKKRVWLLVVNLRPDVEDV